MLKYSLFIWLLKCPPHAKWFPIDQLMKTGYSKTLASCECYGILNTILEQCRMPRMLLAQPMFNPDNVHMCVYNCDYKHQKQVIQKIIQKDQLLPNVFWRLSPKVQTFDSLLQKTLL